MATILVTHGVPREGFAPLHAHRIIIPEPLKAFDRRELRARLPEADAVVACGSLDAELIQCAPRLKIIANYGAGYEGVDVMAAAGRGIPVTNIPDITADSTAELTLGLMLAVARRIGEKNLLLRQQEPAGLFGMGLAMGCRLNGKTLGILGVGHIGGRVARLGQALGMRVIGFSRHGVEQPGVEAASLNELLERSDVLSLHCPLTDETRNLMNRERLLRMKPGAMLINTSRGAVVDCNALAECLASGHLSGAGLDVYPDEPNIPSSLLALPQAVLTPHIGVNTAETRFAMAQACAQQILDVLAGKRPRHIVNGV